MGDDSLLDAHLAAQLLKVRLQLRFGDVVVFVELSDVWCFHVALAHSIEDAAQLFCDWQRLP